MSTVRDPSLGLALSGGGAPGAFDAGVVAAIDEARVISGTSAGELTGAAVVSGRRTTRQRLQDAAWT